MRTDPAKWPRGWMHLPHSPFPIPVTLTLFEDAGVARLAPMTLTRAASDLAVGGRTLGAAAVAAFPHHRLALLVRPTVAGVAAEEHPAADVNGAAGGPTLFVNARWRVEAGDPGTPGRAVRDAVAGAVGTGAPRAFVQESADGPVLLALWHPSPPDAAPWALAADVPAEHVAGATLIGRLWDLAADLPARIAADAPDLARDLGGWGVRGRVEDGAIVTGQVALDESAVVRAGAVVSGADGPVIVGPGVVVEENAVVRGPCVLAAGAVVKAAGRVDGSYVGPGCKVGGEVHASSLHSHSSKAHDGYLGNSVLGRWCNLGADTNTSNLRNDYGIVDLWDPVERAYRPSGHQFLGLVMGDHSKCAINTQFNTGTVVGVFCNLFGAGFHARHVPSFTWGEPGRLLPYRLSKALAVADAVLARRGRTVSAAERDLLAQIAADAHATPATRA